MGGELQASRDRNLEAKVVQGAFLLGSSDVNAKSSQ